MFGVIKFVLQSNIENLWRYTTGFPTLPWYIGELFLDSYPFQKAWAVAGGSMWLKIAASVGFIPLVLYKMGLVIFRYYFTLKAPTQNDYFKIFNYLDAGAITMAAWNDIWSCFVIVYVGIQSRKVQAKNDDFLSNLVKTTELRIIVCTVLSVFSAVLMFQEGCVGDVSNSQGCTFSNVRSIAIDIVYGLYYLDYLIIKYYKVVSTEKTPVEPSNRNDANGWPQPKYTTDIDLDLTRQIDKTMDMDTPSYAIMKSDLRYRSTGGGYLPGPLALRTGGNGSNYAFPTYEAQETTIMSHSLYNAVPKMQYANVQPGRSQQATPKMQSTQPQTIYGQNSDYPEDQQSAVWYQSVR
ncbi:hypothetical protein HK096_008625 [Nowakowskiella sp. JEL0078]|nr:hypothetical protein HK096_008625 [Nowakowskiella sp. JEL0078]